MAEQLRVSLTIPDAARFETVLQAAEAAGFKREAVFATLGVATGSVAASRLKTLEAVEGLASVEPERTYTARDGER